MAFGTPTAPPSPQPSCWSGTRRCGPDGERAIYVHNLAADPAFPGAGLRLLAQAMDMARSKGMKHLRLDTLQSNGALQAYYKRLGFVQMGTVEAEGYAGYLFQCPCDPGLRLEDADRKKV